MKESTDTDYYQIFELSRMVSHARIKAQFKKLVLLNHPDRNKNSGAHRKIMKIYEAYKVLSVPEKRREYDVQTFGFSFWVDDIPIKIELYRNGVKMDVCSFEVFINGVKKDLSENNL